MGNHEFLYHSELSPYAILVYRYLEDRMNKHRECWPSLKTISRDLGISVPTVCLGLRDLVNKGLIEKRHRFRRNGGCTSNLYVVNKGKEYSDITHLKE